MRFKTIHLVIAASLIVLFTACKKESSNSNGDQPGQGYLRAKINGTLWEATRDIKAWGSNKVNIYGRGNDTYPVLQISVGYSGNTGSFSMTDTTTDFLNFQDVNGKLFVIRENYGQGMISITDVRTVNGQKMLTGTFKGKSFTMDRTDSIEFTEGAFYGTEL